ncbi:MAG: hypothetical protein ACYC6A_19575 [Armatimonadota bacterium]
MFTRVLTICGLLISGSLALAQPQLVETVPLPQPGVEQDTKPSVETLQQVTSPALTNALRTPDNFWQFIIAPETSLLERWAAVIQGADLFPVERLPQLLDALEELQQVEPEMRWGMKSHPLSSMYVPEDFYAVRYRELTPEKRIRTILGHHWEFPEHAIEYPITWEAMQRAPWPWLVESALRMLYLRMCPRGDAPERAQHWLDVAMRLPCTTDAEAKRFVRLCADCTHYTTMPMMARLREISLNPEFKESAYNVVYTLRTKIEFWDDPNSMVIGQVVLLDVLRQCPHPQVRVVAVRQLRFFYMNHQDGEMIRKLPASVILAASELALDDNLLTEWDRVYGVIFALCRVLENPPFQPEYQLKYGSPEQKEYLATFTDWFQAHQAELHAAEAQDKPVLDRARQLLLQDKPPK